jgi:hypothetical protein
VIAAINDDGIRIGATRINADEKTVGRRQAGRFFQSIQ